MRMKMFELRYNNIMIDKKDYFHILQDLFEYDPSFRFKTTEELINWYNEYKHDTDLEELNGELLDVAQSIEDYAYEGDNHIAANLSKIKTLITETANIIAEKDEDKYDEITEALEECIPGLEELLEVYPELKGKELQYIYNYSIALMIEDAMQGVEDKPGILTSHNIKEIVEKIALPDIFGYCTDGILMKVQNEKGSFSVIIPFGAKYGFYGIQLTLFDLEEEGREHVAFEWNGESVDISGTISEPYIVYTQDKDVIPIKDVYTREKLQATEE